MLFLPSYTLLPLRGTSPQGETRNLEGLPMNCSTGMELGEALRNTESYRKRTDAVSPPSTMPLILRKGTRPFHRAAQKHGYKSVPDSIAGLSKSGANAEHTGKSCSRLELVVRECGLMLQGMVSVFLIGCEAFYESAEFVPVSLGPGKSGREIGSLYTGIHGFLSAKAAFRPEYSRYT